MKNEIEIRKAIPEDATQLADLAKRGMPGYPFESVYNPESLKQEIAGGINRIVAIDKAEKIIGTAVLGTGHMAEIKRVLVDPNTRKLGLGTRLTDSLRVEARLHGVVPWADVRADQIGMQRAAYQYKLKLTPISVETGKHVVYSHSNNSGAARESMVHMSGLEPGEDLVSYENHESLSSYSYKLVENMAESLITKDKDQILIQELLPSASLVKKQIESNIMVKNLAHQKLTSDIISIEDGSSKCLIITPDASAFVEGDNAKSITHLVDLGLELGLQIVTFYTPVKNDQLIKQLIDSGMEPVMVRPWQNNLASTPEWQVGLRKTGNHFEKCLHPVNLDPWVQAEIMDLIEKIDALNHIWSGTSRRNIKRIGTSPI